MVVNISMMTLITMRIMHKHRKSSIDENSYGNFWLGYCLFGLLAKKRENPMDSLAATAKLGWSSEDGKMCHGMAAASLLLPGLSQAWSRGCCCEARKKKKTLVAIERRAGPLDEIASLLETASTVQQSLSTFWRRIALLSLQCTHSLLFWVQS